MTSREPIVTDDIAARAAIPWPEVVAAQQDVIDELTDTVARHERDIAALRRTLDNLGVAIEDDAIDDEEP